MTVRWIAICLLALPAIALPASGRTALADGSQNREYAALHFEPRAAAGVVVTLTVPAGSAHDPEDGRGTAALTARTTAHQANVLLGELSAELSAETERLHTRFRLLSSPADWREAWRISESVVFGALDAASFDRTRSKALADETFSFGSPVASFEAELDALLATGDDLLHGSTNLGETNSSSSSFADGDSFKRRYYRRELSVVVVTGPVGSSAETRVGSDPSGTASGAISSSHPWMIGGRLDRRREVTASWMAIVYPIAAGTPRTALEFAVALLRSVLDPDPPVPGSHDVELKIRDVSGGTVVLVRAAFHPDRARQWLSWSLAAVEELIDEPPTDEPFRWALRSFRGRRLLEDGDVAFAGARIGDDLLRGGTVRDLPAEIAALSPGALASALGAFGSPRILTFGPG